MAVTGGCNSIPLKEILHSLETRVPQISLQRIEEIYPVLKKPREVEDDGCEYQKSKKQTSVLDLDHADTDIVHDGNLSNLIHRKSMCDFTSKRIECQPHVKQAQSVTQLFQCNICGKSFTKKSILRRHRITHCVNKLYSCSLCDFSIDIKGQLVRHVKRMHSNRIKNLSALKQIRSNEKISSRHHLKQHGLAHSVEESCSCSLCDFSGDSLHLQLKQTHPNDIHRVNSTKQERVSINCDKSFQNTLLLQQHRFTHSDKKSYSCVFCDFTNKKEETFKIHVKTHHSNDIPRSNSIQQTIDSNVCEESFHNRDQCGCNNLGPSGERTYVCSLCDFSTKREGNLRFHVKQAHTNDMPKRKVIEQLEECDICHKFISQRFMRKHELIHKSGKPHPCEICSMAFNFKSTLRKHIKYHNKSADSYNAVRLLSNSLNSVIPHVCPTCKKSFSDSNSFSMHVSSHRVVKSFQCNACPKSFGTKKKLTKHYQWHKAVGFTCRICEESFPRKESLLIHEYTHAKKMYPCRRCEQSFDTKVALIIHEKIHLRVQLTRGECQNNESVKISECQSNQTLEKKEKNGKKISPQKDKNNPIANREQSQNDEAGERKVEDAETIECGNLKFYLCAKCAQVFGTESEYKQHKQSHERMSFKCNDCSEIFTSRSVFEEHLLTHVMEGIGL